MNCHKYQNEMIDLLETPSDRIAATETGRHMLTCTDCRTEFESLRATFAALDDFTAPEPSAWFETRMHARLREAVQEEPEGFFARLHSRYLFGTRHTLRPVGVAALGLMLAVSGAGYLTYQHIHATQASAQASATVQDLERLDNDETTLQQMDQLVDSGQDDDTSSAI